MLNDKLKQFINDKLIHIDYVDEKIKQKDYGIMNKDLTMIYENFDVQEWHNYLPLIDIQVTNLQNIGDGYESLLIKEINEGSGEQFKSYGNYMEISLKIVFLFLNLFKKQLIMNL